MHPFLEALESTAKDVGVYVSDYGKFFGWLPGEEGLTERFCVEYGRAIEHKVPHLVSPKLRFGNVITGTFTQDPLLWVATQIVNIMKSKTYTYYRLMFPTHCAERSIGWDFGWTLRIPGQTERLIFVQAKVVRYTDFPEIHFNYGGYVFLTFVLLIPADHLTINSKKNPQFEVFGKWLEYVKTHCEYNYSSEVNVDGWYLLYGIRQAPVVWISWKTVKHYLDQYGDGALASSAVVNAAMSSPEMPFLMDTLPDNGDGPTQPLLPQESGDGNALQNPEPGTHRMAVYMSVNDTGKTNLLLRSKKIEKGNGQPR